MSDQSNFDKMTPDELKEEEDQITEKLNHQDERLEERAHEITRNWPNDEQLLAIGKPELVGLTEEAQLLNMIKLLTTKPDTDPNGDGDQRPLKGIAAQRLRLRWCKFLISFRRYFLIR